MRKKKQNNSSIFIIALLITIVIFMGIIFLNSIMDNERENDLKDRTDNVIELYENMQALMFMMDSFEGNYSCIALQKNLQTMNKDLWELGLKIDQYRQVTQQFTTDPFYVDLKKQFNRREVLYYVMLLEMNNMCEIDQTIISFYYKKKEFCADCDSQAYVLTDIKNDFEDKNSGESITIFSFDTDMEIPAIDLLVDYHNITEFPCTLIDNQIHCGLRKKAEMIELICNHDDELIICN